MTVTTTCIGGTKQGKHESVQQVVNALCTFWRKKKIIRHVLKYNFYFFSFCCYLAGPARSALGTVIRRYEGQDGHYHSGATSLIRPTMPLDYRGMGECPRMKTTGQTSHAAHDVKAAALVCRWSHFDPYNNRVHPLQLSPVISFVPCQV